MFPDMTTQFHVNSTKQPVFRTTTEKMTIIICGDVSAYVMQEDDTLAYLFTLGAQLTTSFNVAMKGQNVTWRSKVDSFKLELLETAIGDLNIDMIKMFLPTVMNTFINKMGAVGRNLPSFQGYHPTATNITLGETPQKKYRFLLHLRKHPAFLSNLHSIVIHNTVTSILKPTLGFSLSFSPFMPQLLTSQRP
ncbi:putative bactericidal permeability-increasing protein [Apostichopus japonicus]|uniref:Putative bactericidal permeability-increasing protein n=1 Tax=Stichopus japonicus TaxID=307972 RepID=A0A2G8JPF2_STIJA|nr:putative bactericidal permeability-increasing protein [Apostichopus japonicus]